jgi:maltose/maltodextrin transport system substrate-binding protein
MRKDIAMKQTFFALAFLAMTSAGSATDWEQMNTAAREQAKMPIRAGVPGFRPFWNGYAKAFIHPPAFAFKEINGARAYRFVLTAKQNSENTPLPVTHVWTAAKPWFPVPADLWDSLKPGSYTLRVTGTGAQETSVAGERTFHRAAVFQGPYPKGVCDYRTAARRVYAAVYKLPQVQGWKTNDDPPQGYDLYCYPAKIISAMIRALVRHAQAVEKTAANEREDALALACKMADWLIAHSQPAGAPLAHFPPTYWGNRRRVAVKNAGQNMLLYPARAALAYLELDRMVKKNVYTKAALSIAGTYAKLQSADGTWPLMVREKDGTPVRANRLGPDYSLFELFTELSSHDASFTNTYNRAFTYILEGPLKNWNWDGQFEDMDPMPPYQNLQKGVAAGMAKRLFTLGRLSEGCELVAWCEDQFVVWSDPIHHMDWKNWKTPTALEQYDYYTPIDASMGDMIGAFAAASVATGNRLYLEKAKALADNITRHQHADGTIPTYFDSRKGSDWVNCMVFVADQLETLADILDRR